jgi:hypothetical protein
VGLCAAAGFTVAQLTVEQATTALLQLITSNQSEKQGGWLLRLELPGSCRVRSWDLKPGRAAWAVAQYGARTLYLGAGLEGCRIKSALNENVIIHAAYYISVCKLKRPRPAKTHSDWSARRRQPNSERRTRSSTHTVNLPLLPADTAKGAYGPKNSG